MGRIIAGSLFTRRPSEWYGLCISAIFLRSAAESVAQSPLRQRFRPAGATSLRLCKKIRLPGNFTWNTYPFDACAPHGNPDGTPCATASPLSLTEFQTVRPTLIPCDPAQHPQCAEQATAIGERCSGSSSALHRASDGFPCTYPPATSRRVPGSHLTKKQKRRVSRETRRPFPAHHATDQAVFFANPRYVSITRGFCASSAAGPSSANSPVSST